MSGDLIIAGDFVPCEAIVRTWLDHGLEFIPDVHRRIRRRYQKPDTLVWHWTGGEPADGPAGTYRVLRRRGLGVEFGLAHDGTIWQFCDPATVDARDCGSWWDRRSIGVEMINYGMGRPYSRPWNLLGVPKRGRDREIVPTRLRGRLVYVADFTAEQYAAADALADALRLRFEIPDLVPLDSEGRVLDRPMREEERASWAGGEVGHLQITTGAKADPGVLFLEHRARALGLSPA